MIRKLLSGVVVAVLSMTVMAEHHGAGNPALYAAIKAFDHAYGTNDVDGYFSFYAPDATVYVGDGRVDMTEYRTMWAELIESGGGVEMNEMSDVQVQIMPGEDGAVVTSFIDNRTRWADGTVSVSKAFETDVWQKVAGEWKVVSLHYSEVAAR